MLSSRFLVSHLRLPVVLVPIIRTLSSKIDYTKLPTRDHQESNENKNKIDYSKVPTLAENDIEEEFVRGSGPGGQSVNKTANKVVLKHKVTGFVVSNHTTRSLEKNRAEARSSLIKKLDEFYNKENSVEAQMKRLERTKSSKAKSKREKLEKLKIKFKESESE